VDVRKIQAAVRLVLAGALCPCAFGLNPALDISQYRHTSWMARDGFAKGFFHALTQTPDGYLWLGTEFGLFRFDGVRAVPWQPPGGQQLPAKDISSLLVTRDGALWIGTYGGLARWKDGKLTTYAEVSGQRIEALLQDREGTVWMGAAKLCAFRSEGIVCDAPNFSGLRVNSLYEDSQGNLWAGIHGGVWRLQPGPSEHFDIPEAVDGSRVGAYDRSAILIGTGNGLRRIVDGRATAYQLPGYTQPFRSSRIFRDRDGGVWIGTLDRGLLHYHEGKTDAFSETDGLSSDTVIDLFEDREGSIWAATTKGLDRFRDSAVANIGRRQGLSNTNTISLLAASDGSLWIGTYNGLNRWKAGRISAFGGGAVTGEGTLSGWTYSIFEDRRERLWVSTHRQYGYLDRNRFVPVLDLHGGWAFSIAEVPSGHLWIANDPVGLVHLAQNRVVETFPWTALGHHDAARVLLADPSQSGLWLGFARGGVSYFAEGRIQRSYSAADGLGKGRVNGLRRGSGSVLWAATEGGLSRIQDGRITTLSGKNGLPCDTVHWSIEDDDRRLWLYTVCGLVEIDGTELDAWVADPARSVTTTVFDASDGVPSHSFPTAPDSVAKSADGKIWFVAFDGVEVIDPRHAAFNSLQPPVQIEQILADGNKYDPTRGLRLPPLVRNLAVDFVALSLVAPEKNRYRVQLEGWDSGWRDAVNQFRVEYSNLPPRKYRFRVIACNNSGVWNEIGDTLEFSIAPAYYQRTWFYASCVAAFLAMLGGLYRLRLYQIRREFNAQLDGRVDERLRVARELHDTLLQSFQASLIRMQAARNLFDRRPEKAVESLDGAIRMAAGAVAEGRGAIQDLRLHPGGGGDLRELLTTAAQELAHSEEAPGNRPVFRVTVEGEQRNLNPLLQDEVYRIGRELLRNAFRHAQAGRIEVEIRYESRQLRLHVRDDGIGIDPEILKAGGRAGHWGLPGMRERVVRFGGKLEFWSDAGAGTEAVLTVPGAAAYGASKGGRLSFLRRKKRDA
jgi:signal transduction histidine kinase/ligand-binding sensor domain-containing protein